MKKLKYLIAICCLALCSCNDNSGLYVSSTITHKSELHYSHLVKAGKAYVPIIHHYYYFHFNDLKPYKKSVVSGDYGKYEIGDVYTFQISEKEKEYFFTDNIDEVKDNE